MNAFANYFSSDGVELSECRDTIEALLVNSKNQKEFIAGAKLVWSKYRSSKGKVIHGRPSVWKPVMKEIQVWYEDNGRDYIFQKTTDYQLIQHVFSKHPELTRDTVRKYVKLHRLSWTPPQDLSLADWRFLQKHSPGLLKEDSITLRVRLHSKNPVAPVSKIVDTVMERIARALQR